MTLSNILNIFQLRDKFPCLYELLLLDPIFFQFPRTTSNEVKEQELPYEEAGEQAKKGGGEPNHQMDYCDNIRLSIVILSFQMLIYG